MPLLAARKLDLELFDVAGLMQQHDGDTHRSTLPVIVDYGTGCRPPRAAAATCRVRQDGRAAPAGRRRLRGREAAGRRRSGARHRRPRRTGAPPRLADGATRIDLDGRVHTLVDPDIGPDPRARGLGRRLLPAPARPLPCSRPATTRPIPICRARSPAHNFTATPRRRRQRPRHARGSDHRRHRRGRDHQRCCHLLARLVLLSMGSACWMACSTVIAYRALLQRDVRAGVGARLGHSAGLRGSPRRLRAARRGVVYPARCHYSGESGGAHGRGTLGSASSIPQTARCWICPSPCWRRRRRDVRVWSGLVFSRGWRAARRARVRSAPGQVVGLLRRVEAPALAVPAVVCYIPGADREC